MLSCPLEYNHLHQLPAETGQQFGKPSTSSFNTIVRDRLDVVTMDYDPIVNCEVKSREIERKVELPAQSLGIPL
jgi:hypothetical protein